VQIVVTGSRTVSTLFDVMPGGSTVLHLAGLPLGSDTFAANAFGGACASVGPPSVPNWVSDPVVQVVAVSPSVNVPLVMKRNGNANVSVDFPNEPDGGPNDASACMPPTISCGGVCTSVQSDPNNCGMCGAVCAALPHAAPACIAGACTISACNPGFANCNGSMADGCEANLQADVNNCGACGMTCGNRPNTTGSTCTMGSCLITGCLAGFSNCNSNPTDGCETNLQSDVNNCGACGSACGTRPNTVAMNCAMGSCAITACQVGFANCDANAVNGCEVNLQTDVNNCGSCGHKCVMACVAGVCNP
jgi:hypothetical protein